MAEQKDNSIAIRLCYHTMSAKHQDTKLICISATKTLDESLQLIRLNIIAFISQLVQPYKMYDLLLIWYIFMPTFFKN